MVSKELQGTIVISANDDIQETKMEPNSELSVSRSGAHMFFL